MIKELDASERNQLPKYRLSEVDSEQIVRCEACGGVFAHGLIREIAIQAPEDWGVMATIRQNL